ncbi:sigma-70 family RNA polymerase sigma factor [Bacillus sp. 2205SS5-2]|uniref:sigma-70 family RNA polymerase sigma factor n=1 Tax=Bacillus sp. 2205SS5-2 TaxID=3109031 RepID=UPI0030058738
MNVVKEAIKGDDDAFLTLMKEYQTQLYRMAFLYFRNEHDALEAVQETTFRAYQKVHTLKNPQYFSTWLTRILLNYCHDEFKKSKRIVHHQDLVEAKGMKRDTYLIEFWELLANLDEKFQQVLTMKYIQGYKIKEIALSMNTSEGTIKTWLYKAVKQLKDSEMKGEGSLESRSTGV